MDHAFYGQVWSGYGHIVEDTKRCYERYKFGRFVVRSEKPIIMHTG